MHASEEPRNEPGLNGSVIGHVGDITDILVLKHQSLQLGTHLGVVQLI
jgi:hypothetical protein